MITKKCQECDKEFKTHHDKRKFCSQKCFRAFRKGKTYKEMYGEEKSLAIKKKQSDKAISSETWKNGRTFPRGHKYGVGRIPWNKGLKGSQEAWNKGLVMKNYYDEEQYEKFIAGCIKGGVACCLKLADNNNRTKIEIALEEIVKELGIKYMTQYPLLGITVSDIYLPDHHIAIYADGDYWHNYPHGTKKDHAVNKELKNANIKVLRFWEKDIKDDLPKIKKIIKDAQRL